MFSIWKIVPVISLAMLLGACGNGGNSDAGLPTQLHPMVMMSEGRPLNSCSVDSSCSSNPHAPVSAKAFSANDLSASVSMAPANGATLSGIVRLEVSGNAMANVELLPASGYVPKLGVFNISGDGTFASLDLDTTTLPNGPMDARISAFNVPAGQPGAIEVIAMSPRTWNISNSSPASPLGFSATATVAPAEGVVITSVVHFEVRGHGLANVELLPATGYTPKWGVFILSRDGTVATLDLDTTKMPNGPIQLRISAFNRPAGDPNASEIVAMAPRTWTVFNPQPGQTFPQMFVAFGSGPPDGAAISGVVRLSVSGDEIGNAELLPPVGYEPKYAVFRQEMPTRFLDVDWDTTKLPNGPISVRIAAFDRPAGDPNAREITAMAPRTWIINNMALPPPAFGLPTASPGFNVEVYANVIEPMKLSFGSDGWLYVGRQPGVRIHRIPPGGGSVSEFGPPMVDPDAVLFDAAGLISGVPDSVLVGGVGVLAAIFRDQTATTVFNSGFADVDDMKLDHAGRLIFSDDLPRVLVSAGSTPTVLFSTPSRPGSIAIDEENRIFVALADGTIGIYNTDGMVADSAFATGLAGLDTYLAFGPGADGFGQALYVLNGSNLLRFNKKGDTTLIGSGFSIGPSSGTGFVFGPDNALYVSEYQENRILRIARGQGR